MEYGDYEIRLRKKNGICMNWDFFFKVVGKLSVVNIVEDNWIKYNINDGKEN